MNNYKKCKAFRTERTPNHIVNFTRQTILEKNQGPYRFSIDKITKTLLFKEREINI